ncbi:probable methyltransferase At1g29790 [Phragmites australis]|uniref:probable methyltransferase At1g29790 n=1 Tax=Phragmites australis TaxID=29695 RepID=UPI002D78DB9A|nr:probable methyltransferase At1g29790 [Phragmites australis]
MGSVSLNMASSRRGGRRLSCLCSPALLNLLVLLSLLSTNLLALLAFLSPRSLPGPTTTAPSNLSAASYAISAQVAAIAREIDSSRLVPHRQADGSLTPELLLFLSPHALPLGRDARTGLTHMPASVAHACFRSPSTLAMLAAFTSYAPHAACPRNATLPHRLVSKGCEPLPRRRCLSRGPRAPLPASNMGLDNRRWVKPRHDHEFLIDDVLRLSSASSKIRIGFDVAGGAANFAARMRERGVTIVTSMLDNAGKPMNEFVAARGLFPLLLSPAHRFPFYDGVFDLVHVGTTALDEGGAPALGQAGTEEALEFFMFDVDRVLRVGGLLWIDSYMCHSEQRRQLVVRLILRFGYKKLKWVVGEKAGTGSAKAALYLSAVLQKPARS